MFYWIYGADKVTDETYNENVYIDTRIQNNRMIINDDIVSVDKWQFRIDRSVPKIIENLGLGELEFFEEVQNYKSLYDGTIENEENEAPSVTGGWVDVTQNCISSYTSNTRKITKNQNAINIYAYGNGSIPAIAIKNNISDIDYYKIYIKFTGQASTTAYTGNSIQLCYLNVDPTKNKFSIYGANDNRIYNEKNMAYYSGNSYNKVMSAYKPVNLNGYLCIFLSLYSATMSSFSFSADLQNCWIVKQDNYIKLANLAGIQLTSTDVTELLTQENLSKICKSPNAVEYMIQQCTGDFMCELLLNNEAIGYLSPHVKKKMSQNVNWNKFITIYEKQDLF